MAFVAPVSVGVGRRMSFLVGGCAGRRLGFKCRLYRTRGPPEGGGRRVGSRGCARRFRGAGSLRWQQLFPECRTVPNRAISGGGTPNIFFWATNRDIRRHAGGGPTSF